MEQIPPVAPERDQRAALLAATQVAIDTHGYRRFRMDDVVREAQCSRQTAYGYFGTKDDLIREFIAEQSRGFAEVVRDSLRNSRSPMGGLIKGLTLVMEFLATRPSLQGVLREDFVIFAMTKGGNTFEIQSRLAADVYVEELGIDRKTARTAGEVTSRLLFSFVALPDSTVTPADRAKTIAAAVAGIIASSK